jgi:ubiquinone/menaquinone biosynthesis C-methylase UbiE
MYSPTETRRPPAVPRLIDASLTPLRRGIDRTVSVGYGILYDYIFDRFAPYQALQLEVLARVRASIPIEQPPHQVRILEFGCGPGNFSCLMAEAGLSVVGVDAYAGLIELAREKRRARRLAHVAFQHADLAAASPFWERSFDQVVSIHSLYAHPAPQRVLAEAYRVLKPGGHAIFVNHTRRVALGPTFREVRARDGWLAALGCLLWIVPNGIFEEARLRVGPHYWSEDQFARELQASGFTVLEVRRTFLSGASLLVWAQKRPEGQA